MSDDIVVQIDRTNKTGHFIILFNICFTVWYYVKEGISACVFFNCFNPKNIISNKYIFLVKLLFWSVAKRINDLLLINSTMIKSTECILFSSTLLWCFHFFAKIIFSDQYVIMYESIITKWDIKFFVTFHEPMPKTLKCESLDIIKLDLIYFHLSTLVFPFSKMKANNNRNMYNTR